MYAELLSKVQAATGQDRAIDKALALLAGWREIEFKATNINGSTELATIWAHPDSAEDDIEYMMRSARQEIAVNLWGDYDERYPSYTASIDASLALVERLLPGWVWVVESREDDVQFRGAIYAPELARSTEAYAPTAPLAILQSLLLALTDPVSSIKEVGK